jgi:hypothetical protein
MKLNNSIHSLGCQKPKNRSWVRQPFGWKLPKLQSGKIYTAVELSNSRYNKAHALLLSQTLSGVVVFCRGKEDHFYLDGIRL